MGVVKPRNDHNVYILGAGFSRAAGLPIIRDFFDRMRDAHSAMIEQGRPQEVDALERVFEFYSSAASAAYRVSIDLDNIEQLFCLASAARPELENDMRLALACTIEHARTGAGTRRRLIVPTTLRPKFTGYVESSNQDGLAPGYVGLQADLYDWIAGHLVGTPHARVQSTQGKNSIVTFNYDTLLEEALARIGVPFHYGFPAKAVTRAPDALDGRFSTDDSVTVLKLHGSMNWAIPRQVGQKTKIFRTYEQVRAAALVPELVPPTWQKDLSGRQSRVVSATVDALKTATNIFVIGFSIPPTDTHFRYLLAAGLQGSVSLRSITFVNPDLDGIRAQADAVLGPQFVKSGLVRFGSDSNAGKIENALPLFASFGRRFRDADITLDRGGV